MSQLEGGRTCSLARSICSAVDDGPRDITDGKTSNLNSWLELADKQDVNRDQSEGDNNRYDGRFDIYWLLDLTPLHQDPDTPW